MSALKQSPIYGLLAEFETPEAVVTAAQRANDAGFRKMDAYTPFPVHGLSEAVGFPQSKLPWIVFFGGLSGTTTGFLMEWLYNTYVYPYNIGGRPLNSLPSFIIIMFECTILFAGITAVLSMILLNGLPQPYHPVFNAKRFALASKDRFFLCIEARDPKFDLTTTQQFLTELGPTSLSVVPMMPTIDEETVQREDPKTF